MTNTTIEAPAIASSTRKRQPGPKNMKLRQLSKVLYDASQADGEFCCGDSLRLLRMASECAMDDAHGADTREEQQFADRVFDLAALVKSSLRVQADWPLPRALVERVEAARALLAELNDGDDCLDDEKVIKAAGKSAAPAPAIRPLLNGYSSADLIEILSSMVTHCEDASELLLDVEHYMYSDEWTKTQSTTTLRAAAMTVRMMGAMLEQITGTGFTGGPIEWASVGTLGKGALDA